MMRTKCGHLIEEPVAGRDRTRPLYQLSLPGIAEVLRGEDKFFLDMDAEPAIIGTAHWLVGLEVCQIKLVFAHLLISETECSGIWEGGAYAWEWCKTIPAIRERIWQKQQQATDLDELRYTWLNFDYLGSTSCPFYYGAGRIVAADARYIRMLGHPEFLRQRPGGVELTLWSGDQLVAILLPVALHGGDYWFIERMLAAFGDTLPLEEWLDAQVQSTIASTAKESDPKRKSNLAGQAAAFARTLEYLKGPA